MYTNESMKNTPKDERPYEKCRSLGCENLTDAELLAVILRTGTKDLSCVMLARKILSIHPAGDGLVGLHHLTVPQLMDIRGIGEIKAIQIKCLAELSKRMSRRNSERGIRFTSPQIIAEYYMEEMRHKEQEELMLAVLDSKNALLHDVVISKGTVNASMITPREVFLEAFRHHGVNIILIHNHPSGDPTPSSNDILLTRRMKEAGIILSIQLIDHVIIGDHRYTSLKERGIL